ASAAAAPAATRAAAATAAVAATASSAASAATATAPGSRQCADGHLTGFYGALLSTAAATRPGDIRPDL
ncbi:unnamed protein product, partial [Ixodes pacificus]